jgi:hypothetical protein
MCLLVFVGCSGSSASDDDGGHSGDGVQRGDGSSGTLPPPALTPPEELGGFFSFVHKRRPGQTTFEGSGLFTSPLKVPVGQLAEYVYYSSIPEDSCVRPPSASSQPAMLDGGSTMTLSGDKGTMRLDRHNLAGIIGYTGRTGEEMFASQSAYTLAGGETGSAIRPFNATVYSPGKLEVSSPNMTGALPYDPSQDLTLRWNAEADQLPVFAQLWRMEDGKTTKLWMCRFKHDGEGVIPKVALKQMTGVVDLLTQVDVRLKIFKYRWTAVALDSTPALSLLVTMETSVETTINVPQ